jgi:acylglycerol lipase
LFPALASHGIEVYAFDQRGWGRTVTKPSERGLTGPTSRVLADITSFLRTVIPSPVPLFLIGHSMGGGEVLHYIAKGPSDITSHIRGYLFIAPFIDFSPESKPTKLKVVAGRLAGKLFPHRQLVNAIDINTVSRDPTVRKVLEADELCHDTGTLEGLASMLDRTFELSTCALKVPDHAGEGAQTRIWLAHGTKDALTDFGASKTFFDTCITCKDREFKAYEGHFHRCKWLLEPGLAVELLMEMQCMMNLSLIGKLSLKILRIGYWLVRWIRCR